MLTLLQERLENYSPPENPHARQRASVLMPLCEKNSQLSFLLTRRSVQMRSHSGQVSFPGGKAERTDKNALETALRESQEEIGLCPETVTVLGKIDQILSRNFLLVTPFVGLIPASFKACPNEAEIESVFYVPLEFFMAEENHAITEYQSSRSFFTHHFYFEDYDIWGLTALLILRFLEVSLGYIPSYPVHDPKHPTWMEQSRTFRDEHIPALQAKWNPR